MGEKLREGERGSQSKKGRRGRGGEGRRGNMVTVGGSGQKWEQKERGRALTACPLRVWEGHREMLE